MHKIIIQINNFETLNRFFSLYIFMDLLYIYIINHLRFEISL